MKKILIQRRSLITDYGKYHFVYELMKSTCSFEQEENQEEEFFGIRILQFKEDGTLFDSEEVIGVTEDRVEAGILFQRFVEGVVMPVHLPELISDWDYARNSIFVS